MSKRFVITTIAVFATSAFSPLLWAQTASALQSEGNGAANADKWNSDPYNGKGRNHPAIYDKGKSEPAPKRDLSGIWDASTGGGVQAGGAAEHPASYPGDRPGSEAEAKRLRGGAPNENGIAHPLPYTPAGEAALEANKPSGQSVRAVPSVLSNDPANICNPVGFPYMETFQFLSFELAQTKDQVIYAGQFYHNWRIIWTDGRELPKNPPPRWNGYSVGHWQDDYTFVSETVGIDEKSWLDHAGRPHSKDLKVTEIFHLVDHDTMEHTLIIDDPKMYTEPWTAQSKLILHREPPGFDIREMFCSPSETADYDKLFGDPINPTKK